MEGKGIIKMARVWKFTGHRLLTVNDHMKISSDFGHRKALKKFVSFLNI